MEFVGQERVFNILNSYTWQTLPHTLLFLGEYGCGKKTLMTYLANKLGFKLTEVPMDIDPDKLIDYQQLPVKTLYLIDLTKGRLEKEQNKFLKFIEEPSEYVYVVLIADTDVGILPTVLNRCVKVRFEQYSVEQLKKIKKFNNPLAYEVCTTPGQLSLLDETDLTEMHRVCNILASNISALSYANVISMVPRINYKEEYSKFDFNIFFRMLELLAKKVYIETNNANAFKVYLHTIEKRQVLAQNGNIAKETFMTNFFDSLWKETR